RESPSEFPWAQPLYVGRVADQRPQVAVQRSSCRSSRSTRTLRPSAREPMTVRSALAVRPLRPMTLPRSSGCTRTSNTLPLRSRLDLTRTSSELATIPFTRCSSASSSTSDLALGLIGLGFLGCLVSRLGLLLVALLGLLLLARQHEVLQHGLELGFLGLEVPLLGDLERGRGGQALELLPVTGLAQESSDRVGGLCPHGQPVLHPLGIELDEARVLLGVVLTDLLDRPAVTLVSGIGDDDTVLGRTDHSHTLELQFDSHWSGLSRNTVLGA